MKLNRYLLLASSWVLLHAGPVLATDWSAETHTLVAADFDGDGRDDLLAVAKTAGGQSGLARSSPSGQPVFYQTWTANYLAIAWIEYVPHAGDFDGDGRADLFLQRRSGGDHFVLLADNAGEFTAIAQTISDSHLGVAWAESERRVVVGDFNLDGRADLLLQSQSVGTESLVVLSVNGSLAAVAGSWANKHLNPPSSFQWSARRSLVYAGDFDGNDRSDFFLQASPDWIPVPFDDVALPIPHHRDASFGTVLSSAAGLPATPNDAWSRSYLGLDWSPLRYLVFVDDFNGDGYDDLLLQGKLAGDPSYIVLTQGGGHISPTAVVHTLAPGYLGLEWNAASHTITVGDFDGNGRADVYLQAPTGLGINRIAFTDIAGNITQAPVTHNEAWGPYIDPNLAITAVAQGFVTLRMVPNAMAGGVTPSAVRELDLIVNTLLARSLIVRNEVSFNGDGSVTLTVLASGLDVLAQDPRISALFEAN